MRIQKYFKSPLRKSERKTSTNRSRARNMARKRVVHARGCKRSRRVSKYCSKQVSDKLEALKSLIPRYHDDDVRNGSNEIVKVEQLFQETADYIIGLKTQAFVLQKLIEFYEGGDDGSRNEKKQIVQENQS